MAVVSLHLANTLIAPCSRSQHAVKTQFSLTQQLRVPDTRRQITDPHGFLMYGTPSQNF